MSTPSLMRAQARAMMPLFETALRTAETDEVDLTKVGFLDYRQRLLVPFAARPNLKRLAVYAIDDALPLIRVTAEAAAEAGIVGERRRAAMHNSSVRLLGPSWMNDAFMHHFTDQLTKDGVHIAESAQPDALPQLSWLEFDYFFASSNSGCPAHELPLSETLPVEPLDTFPGVAPPKNFLDQFFRLTVDVALGDIEVAERAAAASGDMAGRR